MVTCLTPICYMTLWPLTIYFNTYLDHQHGHLNLITKHLLFKNDGHWYYYLHRSEPTYLYYRKLLCFLLHMFLLASADLSKSLECTKKIVTSLWRQLPIIYSIINTFMLVICCMGLLWLILGDEGVLLACIPLKMGPIYIQNTVEIQWEIH